MTSDPSPPPDEIRTAAAAWAARCSSGMAAPERAAFRAWLRADARHAAAFRAANGPAGDCDWAWTADAVDEVLAGLAQRDRRRRRRRATLAAAAAGVLLAAGAFHLLPGSGRPEAAAAAPTVAVIAPRTLALPDGSQVELEDGAHVTADFSGAVRAVLLDRGTAHFQVAHDPQRPFVVRAGAFAVQAVGTAFAIDLDERQVTVLVTEGVVRIDPPSAAGAATPDSPPLAAVGAGSAVVLPADAAGPSVAAIDAAELRERLSWRIPRLEFSGTPLREVVALMSQHSGERIELGDEAVGATRVSGILRADRVDALIESLQADFGIRAERRGDRVVLRSAR
ncbi:MAG TPA: FecR domain-containing protein [Opitutaceae bacterium]|nr:FecR domain-containing protein [Opitutaceae bacterium]